MRIVKVHAAVPDFGTLVRKREMVQRSTFVAIPPPHIQLYGRKDHKSTVADMLWFNVYLKNQGWAASAIYKGFPAMTANSTVDFTAKVAKIKLKLQFLGSYSRLYKICSRTSDRIFT